MGMYDYVGTEGEQVKCFYVPCINIDEDKKTGKRKAVLHAMGGLLRGFDEVPYMTPYYNYGKDFCIVEYRFEDEPYIHVIREAKFSETIAINALTESFEMPPIVIDNYGVYLNITSVKELKEFIEDYHDKKDLAYVMEVQYLSEYGLSYKLDIDKMRTMKADEIEAESKIRNSVGKRVYDKTMRLFNEKWFRADDDDMIYFGLVVADYIELEITKNPDRYPRTEDDWGLIFKAAYEMLLNRFNDPVAAYFDWCHAKGIVLDESFIRNLFVKYVENM